MKCSVAKSIAVLVFSASICADAMEYHVALDGSDDHPGTADRPFGTLPRAKEAVREKAKRGLAEDVTVWIHQGTYSLTEPLVFRPEDGGTQQFAVTYAARPGERVVVSGGRRIVGWRPGEGQRWTTVVPKAKQGKWCFRNLFVGGQRAVRARSPNRDAKPNCWQLKGVRWSDDRTRYALNLPHGCLGEWQDPRAAEVMVAGNWAINRKRVQSIDTKTDTAVLAPPHDHGPAYIFPRPGRWCYFENAPELLDQPGEWYLDRKTGVLSYWPLAGQNMATVEVVAPAVTQLLLVKGSPESPVRNLHFKAVHLKHTDWKLPDPGYMGIQACHYRRSDEPGRRWKRVPAAIHLSDAQACSIQGCTVAHLSGSGIELADGCQDCLVQGNHVLDVSANGVMVGGPKIDRRVPSGNRVSNNHVHACGREYYGAIGIWVGFARKTTVSHNLVHGLPYTGVSVGWEWNPQPTPCTGNVVELNHIYDVMNRLCDGGCIYTLGFQPGTVIRDNHLHGVHRSAMAQGAPNNGMFIDQGSKGYLFERNVIYDTSAELIRFNQCQRDWHQWKENHVGEQTAVQESGKEIIEKAGLQSPWRETLTADESPSDLSFVPEMNGVAELDILAAGKRWSEIDRVALDPEVARARADWRKRTPQIKKRLTPELVRSLSRWAKPQMERYEVVPSLENVDLKPVGVDVQGTKLLLEATIDTLPTHHNLVTRWLKAYLVYDLQQKSITHVTITIRGQILE